MPKKIDDILNPKPPRQADADDDADDRDTIIRVLAEAKKKGSALTKDEILSACRFHWIDVVPPGEGGIMLELATMLVGTATGATMAFDKQRSAVLKGLVESGKVIERPDDKGVVYYWLVGK